MSVRFVPIIGFLLAVAANASAQDRDAEKIKKAILEKVKAKLADERAKTLHRIEKIIDEELSKKKADSHGAGESDKRIKELERKMRILEEQREELAVEIEKTKRLAADEGLKREAKKSGPQDEEEAGELFKEAFKSHEEKDFVSSIRKFKMVYYNFPKAEVGATSAYNVACAYALEGKKDYALDWLEISVQAGFGDFEHLRKDEELDSLRDEKRYKKLLADK